MKAILLCLAWASGLSIVIIAMMQYIADVLIVSTIAAVSIFLIVSVGLLWFERPFVLFYQFNSFDPFQEHVLLGARDRGIDRSDWHHLIPRVLVRLLAGHWKQNDAHL